MNKREIIERLKNIAGHAVHTVGEEPFVMSLDDGIAVHEAIELLEKQEPLIDREQAIDYLHKTGWLQNHDRILTESKIVPPVQPDEKLEKCRFEYIHACQTATNPTPDTTRKDRRDAYAVIKALYPIFGDVPFAKVERGKADGQVHEV